MLKTNSKEVMNRIKKIIMDSYEAAEEYYTYEGATMKTEYNEICKDILNMFYIEKLHLDNRYKAGRISKSDLFMDWMQELPTAFPVADDIFLHSAVDFLAVCPAYAVLAGLLSLQALIWHFTAVYMLTCVFYRL